MFQKDQLSVGDWILYNIIMMIPLVNIIVFIVILASGDSNKTLKNYLWAQIVMAVIVIVLVIMFMGAIAGWLSQFDYNY